MKKRLVIHIGIEKTGTTSLQHYLYLNEARLASHGIGLLQSVGSPNNRLLAHYASFHDRERLPVSWRGEEIPAGMAWYDVMRQRMRAEIEALPESIQTVAVSSEHLHSRLRTVEDVQNVADLFDGLFETIDIVVYLRRQDRLAVSLYSTALRVGWTYDNVLPKTGAVRQHYYDFQHLLERWSRIFGEDHMTVRLFERSQFANGSLYADFLQACGWPELVGQLEDPPAHNESLSAVGATALLAINQAVARFMGEEERVVGRRVRLEMADKVTQCYPRGKPTVTKAQAHAFLADFAASNAEVERRWFGGRPVFGADLSDYPDELETIGLPWDVLTTVSETVVQYILEVQAKKQETLQPALLRIAEQKAPADRTLRQVARVLHAIEPQLAKRLTRISVQIKGHPGFDH